MAAYARRTKTRPKHEPYPHENTHVFLPDGSSHLVEKTSIGRTSREYDDDIKILLDPWEKDEILRQAEEQKTPEWNKYVMPGGSKPLDRGGLRAARSNVPADKVKNWDTFEISFDRADVADPARQEAVFSEVVEWAKQIHTEGLEGGRRAFTIQDWHGLDGTSSRPHLRLEIHRIGWEPTPKLVEANGDRKVLEGRVQQRQNYSQESGETDKDFQPLVAALRHKFGINLQVGSPSLDRDVDGREAASAAPPSPAVAEQEANRLLSQAQSPSSEMSFEAPVVPAGVVTIVNPDKEFDLRRPVDPFKEVVTESYMALQQAQRQFELVRAAQLTYAANEQLNEQVRVQGGQIIDLQTQVVRKDEALVERDQALEQATGNLAAASEKLEQTLAENMELSNELDARNEELKDVQGTVEKLEAINTVLVEDRDQAVETSTQYAQANETLTKQVEGLTERATTAESELSLVKRERDNLESRNEALAERNGELVGENKIVHQRLTEVQGDLKLAREELAPIVAENAELKTERERLLQENEGLTQGNQALEAEIERRKLQQNRLKAWMTVDNETLNAKVVAMHDDLERVATSPALNHEPEMREMLMAIRDFIQTKENYISRAEVYMEEGMPLPGDTNFESTQERITQIHVADGDFGLKGGEVARAVFKSQQPQQEEARPAAPAAQGPRPNPTATGAVTPRPGTGGSPDQGRLR